MTTADEERQVTHAQPPPAPPALASAPTAMRVALPLPAAPATLQRRVELVLVRALPQIKYQLVRVGPAGLTGLGVLAAAAVAALALLLPAQQSVIALRGELSKLGHVATAHSSPEQTPQQFAASLPTREQIPAILGIVLVQATDAGVNLDQGRYTYSPPTQNRLAHYTFEFPVKGDYGNIRAFIDKSLAAVPALGLDKLHVERKNVGDTLVNADVGFVIYMRGA